MKVFKKLASVMLALTLCLGLFGLVACNKNDEPAVADSYYFQIIKEDGNPADSNYSVQLCTEDGLTCRQPVKADENGYVHVKVEKMVYVIHVFKVKEEGGSAEQVFQGPTKTTAEYNSEPIILTLYIA